MELHTQLRLAAECAQLCDVFCAITLLCLLCKCLQSEKNSIHFVELGREMKATRYSFRYSRLLRLPAILL